MATYIKDGVRIKMTQAEEAAWIAHVASRPPQPPNIKPKAERLADLFVSKGILTQTEIDNL